MTGHLAFPRAWGTWQKPRSIEVLNASSKARLVSNNARAAGGTAEDAIEPHAYGASAHQRSKTNLHTQPDSGLSGWLKGLAVHWSPTADGTRSECAVGNRTLHPNRSTMDFCATAGRPSSGDPTRRTHMTFVGSGSRARARSVRPDAQTLQCTYACRSYTIASALARDAQARPVAIHCGQCKVPTAAPRWPRPEK